MTQEPHDVLGVSRVASWHEIRSAFRALARRYHADGEMPDQGRMAAINAAYEALERRREAIAHHTTSTVPASPGVPVGPGPQHLPAGSLLGRMRAARHPDSPMLDFGQYAGWRIADVADHDPRYLVWLSRHSSGIRFRRAIEQVLGANHDLGRPAAVVS